jgi:hypothetical protein
VIRGVGSIKDWGGAPASRGTLGFRKGDLKNFSRKCWRRGGGGGGGGSRRTIPKLHVFDQIFFKNLEISKQKGHL